MAFLDPVRGPAREPIDGDELRDAPDRAAILQDRRRSRPRYFDDRFLTARDLTRGQQYCSLRQADLGQIGGTGVISGLELRIDAQGARLTIETGVGIARSGEMVAIREQVHLQVRRLPIIGGGRRVADALSNARPRRRRSGLFVLVARPVEYAREPITAFPTSVSGERTLHDGETAEATWLTLMPIPSVEPRDVQRGARARLAREVFLEGLDLAEGTDGLALAVVGLVADRVSWVDMHLVRREVGGDSQLGTGIGRRKHRLAFQRHYVEHLREVLAERRDQGVGEQLRAEEAFQVLPPVGPLPRAALVARDGEVLQSFFPASIYAEVTVVPEDELASFVSEGLVRAPIDLTASKESLESVPVLIVVPVPRAWFADRVRRLAGASLRSSLPVTGRPLALARPFDGLSALRRKSMAPAADPTPLDLKAWRSALESTSELWYMRRPQFAPVSAVVPRVAEGRLDGEPLELLEEAVRVRILGAEEGERFNGLLSTATTEVILELGALLGDPTLAVPALITAVLAELAYATRRPRTLDALPTPPVAPRSPVFDRHPSLTRVVNRPVEMTDVTRISRRFRADGVAAGIGELVLTDVRRRAVLGQTAIVPELGAWTLDHVARVPTGPSVVHGHLDVGDIAALRELVVGVELRVPRRFSESRAVERLASFGADRLLNIIWEVADAEFREDLDDRLADLPVGTSPPFVTTLLIKLIEWGFGLDIDTARDARAFLTALVDWAPGTALVVPNVAATSPNGELLAAPSNRARDDRLRESFELDSELVAIATTRMITAGFPGSDPPTPADAAAFQLLGLASTGVAFLDSVVRASDSTVDLFVHQALQAVANLRLTEMRRALVTLIAG